MLVCIETVVVPKKGPEPVLSMLASEPMNTIYRICLLVRLTTCSFHKYFTDQISKIQLDFNTIKFRRECKQPKEECQNRYPKLKEQTQK